MPQKKVHLWLFFTLLLTTVVYWSSLDHPFTNLDDQVQVTENQDIRAFSLQAIGKFFQSTYVGMYQPLTTTAYATVYQFAELNPFAFHLLSLLLHLLNVWLIFKLLARLKLKPLYALIGGALFALHPMQVESVAWVSATSNLLFSSFYLWGLLLYLNYQEKQVNIQLLWVFLLFVLSGLSKATAISFPLVLFLFDYFNKRTFSKKLIIEKIPFLLIAIGMAVITINSRESAGHLSDLSISFDLFDRLFLISYSILFYPISFLFPLKLSAFYPYPEIQGGMLPWLYYAAFPLLVFLAVLIVRQFNKNRYVFFSAACYLITIAPVLQFVPVGNQLTTDRYLYLPLFALLFFVLSAIENSSFKQKIVLPAMLSVIALLSVGTFLRTEIWASDQLIWEDVIQKYPKVAQAWNNLGNIHYQAGRQQQALTHYNRAIALKPYYADAFSNRGSIHDALGNTQQAIADYTKAIELRPHADAYFNRGNLWLKAKDGNSAVADFTASIQLQAKADAYTNRALVYLQSGEVSKAMQDLNRAIQLEPDFAGAYYLKGMAHLQMKDEQQACALLRQAADLGDQRASNVFRFSCSN